MAAPARLELGSSLAGLTKDPAWLSRYAKVGLVALVPLVGPIAMMGWQRRVYELAREGDEQTLPPVRLGQDISHGLPVFVAMLNLVLPLVGVLMLVGMVAAGIALFGAGMDQAVGGGGSGAVQAVGAVAMLLVYGLVIVLSVALNLLVPELQRRGFNGDMMPMLAPGESLRALRTHPGAYGVVIVGLFVANAVASIGVFACYVGMFVTIPMSLVIIARLVARWDAVVEESLYGELSAQG